MSNTPKNEEFNNIKCSFIVNVNNMQCKFKSTNIFNHKYYCTRHFNILNKIIQKEENKENNKEKSNDIESIINIIDSILDLKNYTKLTYLNSGTFYEIYKIIINDKTYAIKFQNLENNKNILYYEYLLFSNIFNNNENILKIEKNKYYYKSKQYAILLTEYMEMKFNIYKLNFNLQSLSQSINAIKNIGIQLINAIKYIHQKNIYILI